MKQSPEAAWRLLRFACNDNSRDFEKALGLSKRTIDCKAALVYNWCYKDYVMEVIPCLK
jgi:hypothetical protein